MSWASFVANIHWFSNGDTWGGGAGAVMSPDGKTAILNALQALYNTSSTAQGVMDRSVANGPLYLGALTSGTGSGPAITSKSGNWSLFDLGEIQQFAYFNDKGVLVPEILGLSIIHELIHAIDDLDDLTVQAPNEAVLNGANFDQTGAVVAIQNAIAQEMGWIQNHQVSYLGAVTSIDPTASDLQMGLSYTEFHTVETVRIGAWFPNKTGVSDYIDHSLNTVRTKDLILAWDGADTIYAGAGDDYVYGGRGEDKILGGAGNDLIHGGDLSLTEAQDGYDVADYSQIASNQNATSGITVDFNFQDPLSYLGQRAIKVEDDGTGGVDRLVSIEKIVGSGFADTFKIEGAIANNVSMLVDGNGGVDVINASVSGTNYTFLSKAGGNLEVHNRSGQSGGSGNDPLIKFKAFDGVVQGGEGSDYFVVSGALKVNGGAGADYLVVRSNLSEGGAGNDRFDLDDSSPFLANVDGGAGDDVYFVNSSTNLFVIKFDANSGHDVVFAKQDWTVIVDFGNVPLSSLAINWNRQFFNSSTGQVEGQPPQTIDSYVGEAAIVMPTGASIALGDIVGRTVNGVWAGINFHGDFRVKGAEGELTFQQFAQLIGLLGPSGHNGNVLPGQSAASNHTAYSSWMSAYFAGSNPPTGASAPGPLAATAGNDTFVGNALSQTVSYAAATSAIDLDLSHAGPHDTGGSGHDELVGITEVIGSAFNDHFVAGGLSTIFRGGAGDDTLYGADGSDQLYGGAGDDEIWGAAGADEIDGGDGYDTLVVDGDRANFAFHWQEDGSIVMIDSSGAEGVDHLANIEAVWFDGPGLWQSLEEVAGDFGSEFADFVSGTAYSDALFGLGDGDELYGRGGDDILDGGEGYDQAVYDGASTDFVAYRNEDGSVTLIDGAGQEGSDMLFNLEAVYFRGDDTWISIEDLAGYYGTADDDNWVAGTAGDDRLYGLEGDDELIGLAGDDHLYGGDGEDQADFFGLSSNYSFTLNPDGTVTATDLTGAEGVDVLDSVEFVYFVDDDVYTSVAELVGLGARTASAGLVDVGWPG